MNKNIPEEVGIDGVKVLKLKRFKIFIIREWEDL